MKGTTVEMALKCAMKVKKGQYCTPDELRASLDTLAYAYKKVKPTLKRVRRKIPERAKYLPKGSRLYKNR